MEHPSLPRRCPGLCAIAAVAVVASMLGGCSSSLESEVSGTVTLDGRPIGPGSVTFAPVAGSTNPALGAVQANGSYYLKTSRTVGLVAGRYRVCLYVPTIPPGTKPTDRLPFTQSAIPEKYTKVETSELQYEVSPGRNSINIELTSQ